MNFRKELEALINRYNMESNSNTPDFILAEYLNTCLTAFDEAVNKRNKWYGQDTGLEELTVEKNGKK